MLFSVHKDGQLPLPDAIFRPYVILLCNFLLFFLCFVLFLKFYCVGDCVGLGFAWCYSPCARTVPSAPEIVIPRARAHGT